MGTASLHAITLTVTRSSIAAMPWPWSVPCYWKPSRGGGNGVSISEVRREVSVDPLSDRSVVAPLVRGPAGDQMSECDEHRSTDDGPEDGEGMPVDVHDQQFGKAERVGQCGPEERTDEADGDRNDETAAHPAGDDAPDSATHAGDEQ